MNTLTKFLSLGLLLLSLNNLHAQVGIGTTDPKTSLQVVGEPASTTTADGVQVPSLSLAELDAKVAAYGTDQNGSIVFIDDITTVTSSTETASIDAVGFYYYDADNDTWKVLSNNSTLADGSVTSAKILDGEIVNADISSSAAIAQSKIDGLSASLANKANLASPTFTGTVSSSAFSGDGSALTGVTNTNFDLTGAVDGDLLRYDAATSKWVKVTPDYISNGDSNVGFGATTIESSAALEVKSTTQGFLPPRMTTNDRNLIAIPVPGLMIYNTTTNQLNLFNAIQWSNMDGTSASSASNAPAISGVTSGNGKVDVAFTAPADNGGSTITTYTATSNPGGITGSISQAGSGTITVSGLTNGTAYTFTVTATNAVGTSAASAVSDSVTPLAPVTYTILDQYTNRVPTGTSYIQNTEYNEYIDAGSVDASPFTITKLTSYAGGIVFYGSTELNSQASENTFRLSASTGNFDFISFYLDDLEPNINSGTSSTLPRITLTSSSGSTVTYEATVMFCDDFMCMYMYSDTGIKTLNWTNIEWVDIKTQYVKAKTKTYVLKTL
ncbi:fibronectin type III domain-containing protein [Psychroflexus maritimus]|uniref:Fibronectin type III domain-containing protein n=1 Tax=Psychroflexus maritimus TaxID=2714865 RepID=A0A967DYV4_9FLAO|nr:fibronectin type III domain-containing protein [Psychroflexus maritimus]NGZ90215.1 fibronectin type III domain-containing protein [Psychroflexus maritimus]